MRTFIPNSKPYNYKDVRCIYFTPAVQTMRTFNPNFKPYDYKVVRFMLSYTRGTNNA